MGLRFFTDHCISNFIIKTLQDAGNEVFRLRDYISTDSADQIVISKHGRKALKNINFLLSVF